MDAITKQLIVGSIGLAFAYCGALLRMGVRNSWLLDAALRITSFGQSSLSSGNREQAEEALSSIGILVLCTGLVLIVVAAGAWLFLPNQDKGHGTSPNH